MTEDTLVHVMYSDDAVTEISVERLSPGEPDFLPNDGVLGYGAVEIALTKIPDRHSKP